MDSSEVRHLVVYFLCLCFAARIYISALNQKLAGLDFLFKLRGIPDFTKDFLVRQAIRGYRITITFDMLQSLFLKMTTGWFISRPFGWFGFVYFSVCVGSTALPYGCRS